MKLKTYQNQTRFKIKQVLSLVVAGMLAMVVLGYLSQRAEQSHGETANIDLLNQISGHIMARIARSGELLEHQLDFYLRHDHCINQLPPKQSEHQLVNCLKNDFPDYLGLLPIQDIFVFNTSQQLLGDKVLDDKVLGDKVLGDKAALTADQITFYLEQIEPGKTHQTRFDMTHNGASINAASIVFSRSLVINRVHRGFIVVTVSLLDWLKKEGGESHEYFAVLAPLDSLKNQSFAREPDNSENYNSENYTAENYPATNYPTTNYPTAVVEGEGLKNSGYQWLTGSEPFFQTFHPMVQTLVQSQYEIPSRMVVWQNHRYLIGLLNLTQGAQGRPLKLLFASATSHDAGTGKYLRSIIIPAIFLVMGLIFWMAWRYLSQQQAILSNRFMALQKENRLRKDIERELIDQRNMLSSLMDAIPVPLFYKDRSMIYRGCNQPFLHYLGLQREQVEGKSVYDIAPTDLADLYQQADISLLKKGGKQIYESQVEYADKTRHEIKFFKSVYDDAEGQKAGIIGVMLDITEMKAASKLLTKQRRYLQTIINSVSEPIRVINLDYSIALMNRAAEDAMDSRNIQDLMHPRCYELFGRRTPCEGENYPCPIHKILDIKSSTKVTQDHSDDKNYAFVELTATPLFDSDGKINQIVEISRDITSFLETQQKLQKQKIALSHLANHDTLTNLPNRRLFFDRLQHSVNLAQGRDAQLVVLFIDLDRFKPINDSLGHEMGDRVLKLVAGRLVDSVRINDTVARLGGDEFIILLETTTTRESLSRLSEALIKKLAEPMVLDEHELFISTSIGISIYPEHGDNAHNLIKHADIAMYSAKEKGGNQFDFYSHRMQQQASERISMESKIRKALASQEFEMVYQPQFDLQTGNLVGMEALIRWNHPEQGFITPDRFIPIAEHSGLIIPLGEWIFENTIRQVKQWRDIGLNTGRVAVNLSGVQLQQENIYDNLCALLEQVGCRPEWIELEITEGFIMRDPEQSIGVMRKFQQLGIQMSIDDFGTGYSSLAYLKRLPISKLKIDRSFISDIPHDEDDIAISEAIIALAKSMNMRVLAEGVETEQQAQFLTEAGCDEVQGYYFSRPQDVVAMGKELQKLD